MAFFSKVAVVVAVLGQYAECVAPKAAAPVMDAKAVASPKLRGLNASVVEHALIGKSRAGAVPCQCVPSDPSWKPCTRTVPRCVFIDLGAADGNSFGAFLKDSYGPVAKCPSMEWSAVLVEANPRFDAQLTAISNQQNGKINLMSSTAAYMCEAKTSFYLDTVNTAENFWGSSMNSEAPDVQKSGQQKVTVPTMNLNKILFEQTIAADWVMVKMDIEGSEFDVLPCMAKSASSSLIDRLYLEEHKHLPQSSWGMAGTTPQEFEDAKAALRAKGVDIPAYFSYTL